MRLRSQAPNVIVEEDQLMDVQQILAEKWRIISLSEEISNNEQCIQWLAKRGLIKNNCLCDICGQPSSLLKYAVGILDNGDDGVRWGCSSCNFRQTIRSSSFFERSELPLITIVFFIYYWCVNYRKKDIAFELAITKTTVLDWCDFCLEECKKWTDSNNLNLIEWMDTNFQFMSKNSLKFSSSGFEVFLKVIRENYSS